MILTRGPTMNLSNTLSIQASINGQPVPATMRVTPVPGNLEARLFWRWYEARQAALWELETERHIGAGAEARAA